MITAKQRASLAKSVEALKAKGVTGIKVELEAQMGRRGDFDDTDFCLDWMMSDVAGVIKQPVQPGAYWRGDTVKNPFSWMKYAHFYNDGSVDSEITFTIKLDDPNNIYYLPEVIKSFKRLSDANGRSFTTSGAGMHMALLFNSSCTYPSNTGMRQTRRRNMKRSVMQLLPALYFLAATDDNTRGIGPYRRPQISMDYSADSRNMSNPKYSAISYRQGAMEFRVFDTCYETPNRILDNIAVMANCVKFATIAYKSPNIEKICRNMTFGNDAGTTLGRLYHKEEHLDVLNAGLKILKPDYYTVKEVKEQRKFTKTKTQIKNVDKDLAKQAKDESEEYQERFKWRQHAQRLSYRAGLIDNAVQNMNMEALTAVDITEVEEQIQPQLESNMNQWTQRNTISTESWIADRVNRLRRAANNNTDNFELRFE